MVIFLSIHVLLRPFSLTLDNYAETIAEATLIILCMFLSTGGSPISPGLSGGLTAMCFVVGMLFVGRVLLSRYSKLMTQWAGGKEKAAPRNRSGAEASVSRPAQSRGAGGSPVQLQSPRAQPAPSAASLAESEAEPESSPPAIAADGPRPAAASVAPPPPPPPLASGASTHSIELELAQVNPAVE
jgi:hypothetical protein